MANILARDLTFIRNSVLDKIPINTKIAKKAIPIYQITYINSTGFGVYVCEDEYENQFNIRGIFIAPLNLGQTYEVEGKVVTYASTYRTEKQVDVESIKNIKPLNRKGIISYLMTLKGLKMRAYDIYSMYKEESIDVLMNNPEKVAREVKGIGKKTAMSWKRQLDKMKDTQEAMTFLLNYELSVTQSRRLYEKYGNDVMNKIKENPYILVREVDGFGFLSCDRIARNIGFPPESIFRISEGIVYVLKSASERGHCYLPKEELVKEAIDILSVRLTHSEMVGLADQCKAGKDFIHRVGMSSYVINSDRLLQCLKDYDQARERYLMVDITRDKIEDGIRNLIMENRLIIQDDYKVYLMKYYDAESEVSLDIERLISTEQSVKWPVNVSLSEYCKKYNINLEEKQKEAIISFSQSIGGVYILNGSAGCGKTFTIQIILDMLKQMYQSIGKRLIVELLAPTGKAAKVVTNTTGVDCKTIHRGLMYSPEKGFQVNRYSPLEANVIVVDESSMPGIIKNATSIVLGEMIENRKDTSDAYIINRETSEGVQNAIIRSIERVIETKQYELKDIQLLCPQRRGSIGTEYLNYVLQQKFNPDNNENKVLNKALVTKVGKGNKVSKVNLFFKKGDKVIHTRNNYDIPWCKKVFRSFSETYEPMGIEYVGITNGECGVIEEIVKDKDFEGNTITKTIVKYDDKYIIYIDKPTELDHAYALTIHKCITEDTFIYTNKGIKQVKDLNNGARVGEFKPIVGDIKVFNGKYLEKPSAFYNSGKSIINKITTRRGYSLKATDNHRIYVLGRDGYIKEKFVEDITTRDYLLISKNSETYGDIIDLPDNLVNQSHLDYRAKKYRRPTELTKELARFLGMVVADGTVTHGSVEFSKRYKEVTRQFKDDVKAIFGYENGKIKNTEYGSYFYNVYSVDIADFCSKIDGLRPNDKYVPSIILSAPKVYQCEFLKGLFEDGTVYINNGAFNRIELKMKSKSLIEQVKAMLLNMGILSTQLKKRTNGTPYYSLYIYRDEAKIFAENIGFISDFKNERLSKCFDYQIPRASRSRKTIPYVLKIIERMIKKNRHKISDKKYKQLKWVFHINRKDITYDVLDYVIKDLERELKENSDYLYLKNLKENFFIDKIDKISKYEDYAYCLEMPESSDFIQNGIYARNSQGSQWPAVITPIMMQNYIMLDNNLFYTAYTRAEDFVVTIGQDKAIRHAIKTHRNRKRYTSLKELVAKEL